MRFSFYPMIRTDASKVGSRTGAEVERRHREAASLQTHHVGTTGSAILHIAQVRSVLQQSMSTSVWSVETYQTCWKVLRLALNQMDVTHSPAVQVFVLVVQGEAGHLTQQVSELWLHRHIGAEEEAAQNIPVQNKREPCLPNINWSLISALFSVQKQAADIRISAGGMCDSRLVALQPTLAFRTWTTVAFLRPLRV